jgi:D-alanyl-lipoteichoic acid acyltransferase DltB (MBOAT superfamily)
VTELTQPAGRTRHRIPLHTYLDYRLGRNRPWWRQTYNVLVRPLAAPSLAEFWRTWNPVWGYYLSVWCYRPVRRMLPHAVAVMVTFTVSGLVHNLLAALLSHRLNPFVTVWFMLYGVVMVASEALHMDLSRLPAPARILVNLAYLIGCYKLVSPLLPWSIQLCMAGGQQC